ncbi:MAG: threonine--tRNA ligase [Patescibacteria group bacterium]|nr:threonine--tRNA ligase [Patescibacteria group bacterium]
MDNDDLKKIRHSCEHVLTQAMLKLYPKIKMAMGPATENGFYFDFDSQKIKINEDDLTRIEEEMRKIAKADLPIRQEKVTVTKARQLFKGNPYKQEWLDEIDKRNEEVSLYWTGQEFVDLCSGPHVSSTGKIGYFKLLSVAGAYWRGDEKNKMLTRIYGTSFATKEELDCYLWQIEEAKKRDHRKLGKELGLFILTDEVGPGLIIWTPKGATLRREVENFIIEEQTKRGYQHVYTPHIGKKSLWVTSGHWDLYRDKMYAPMKIDNEDYLVKPMNCPMHMMVYKSQLRSYKDLPVRLAENATVYRYEQTGELSGMVRVRYITQDDAHLFCREDQVIQEFVGVVDYIMFLLKTFQINDFYLRLSLRDPKNKDKYLGNDEIWQEAETKIEEAVKKTGLTPKKAEGEAAFYGPKLDVMVKDSLGREWQCGTVQVDFMLPERFNLEYVDRDGQKKRPVLIHRAPLGALERWVGLLIEHYAGNFPLWLSPVQVTIIPIAERHADYASEVKKLLAEQKIRVEIDDRNETMQAKVREATLQKVPYMVIIGDKEAKNKTIAVRTRKGQDQGETELNKFILKIAEEIKSKSITD